MPRGLAPTRWCSNHEPEYAPLPQRKVAVATLYAGDATEWSVPGTVPPVLASLYAHLLGLTGRPDVLLLHLPQAKVDEAVFGIEDTTGSSVIRVQVRGGRRRGGAGAGSGQTPLLPPPPPQLPSLTSSGKNQAVADAVAKASLDPGACPRPISDRRLAQYIVAHLLRLPQVRSTMGGGSSVGRG